MDVLMHEASQREITEMQEIKNNGNVANGGTTLPNMPKIEPVDIEFSGLVYTASLGFRKGKKEILHEVNGRLPPGKLIAIMGPSGAGKSTLLDILSGYRVTGVDGKVLVNGVQRDLNSFRRKSCYIQQDDRLQPLLTTWENMRIAADLKLGVNVESSKKEEVITNLLETIGLLKARSTRAGRLSGGQKKRLSIALELINNPLVLFLDEPTTGLDSSSCMQCVKLLQDLARQGRTVICTIHQPSASLFQMFDLVYVLSGGQCLYQGTTGKLLRFLDKINMPCPKYHNPADYVIELACGEHGEDKIKAMVTETGNGKNVTWYENLEELTAAKHPDLREENNLENYRRSRSLQETSLCNQIKVLMSRGYIKTKRDSTLTHLRIIVNILTGFMLGILFIKAGDDASRILDNYNLMFAILMHHMMSTMMLTILTFPSEINILIKEHFNRWYSLKAYYMSLTIVDLPVTILGCALFTVIVYFMSDQPAQLDRFFMFFTISLLVVLVAQGFGLMIGAVFNVVNGTFLGPTLSVPIMMFSGFGVAIKDLPSYMKWGSYVSYLRYGIEGYVGAIYGGERPNLQCHTRYCHYKYPNKFLKEVDWTGDQFWNDVSALVFIVIICRVAAFLLLKWKLKSIR